MKLWEMVLLFATASAVLAQDAQVLPTNQWRAFTKADGLQENTCRSVTIGASGEVFIRYAGTNTISVLNGYVITHLRAPGTNRYRVYEGRAGQLWVVAPEGLQVATLEGLERPRDPRWVLHRVPEIAEHFRAGGGDNIPLCPVRLGVAVFLLADRLMLFDAGEPESRQTILLRAANQTGLGSFTALSLARDDSLWISGTRGVARIAGPLRNLRPDSAWEELVPPADLQVRNFQAVQDDETGGWFALADSAASPGPLLVAHEQKRWSVRALKQDQLRFAWRGLGKTWVATAETLFQLTGEPAEPVPSTEIAVRPIFDVAVEPGGAFWLATADGLFRNADPIWKPPVALGADQLLSSKGGGGDIGQLPLPDEIAQLADWTTYLITRSGDLWLGGEREIAWRRQDSWEVFSAANLFGLQHVVAFAETPDARVWCATLGIVWVFNGRNWLVERAGFDRINGLCAARDGTLWVATDTGVHRFVQNVWIANGPEDGLPSALARAVFEDQRGRIWVVTPLGASEFNPEADADPPQTYVDPIAAAKKPYREGVPVSLSFSGRDKWKMSAADSLLFSYRLDGREWSPFRDIQQVAFADLWLGKHVFHVRAMDRAGNVDPEPAALEFVVALPWYREPRLVVILAAALVVALFFAGVAFNRHRLLRRSYAVIEEQVAARTRELELANRELLQSQKMNALGTLAAGIAHDFNNILSIIKGSAQIIEENLEHPAKVRLRLDRINTVVAQGAGIVRAMLGFSRTSDEVPTPCDVNAVVGETITLLGDRFLREVEITFNRAPGLPAVSAVKDFIQQIVLNFLFNAAESMTGRKRIILATSPLNGLPPGLILKPASANGFVSISVQDFGCGIPPENLPRIFEPFFTTKALSTRRGTGLGLSMVYELAQRMNAGLAVETVVGQGSTFMLVLPVRP